jgi:phenylacetate-CoA ligase
LKYNDISQLSDSSDIIATKEIQILYGYDGVRKISDFDIIDKQMLKKMISNTSYYKKISFKDSLATSGSTGNPLQVPIDSEFLKYKFASFYFFKEIHGSGIKTKSGNFFGRKIFSINQEKPPFWIYSLFTNQLLFSQYHLNEKTIEFYIKSISKYKLKTIHGYPSVLVIFSELVRKSKLISELHNLKISNITVGSETLNDNQRKFIEDTFNCPVFNFYGQTESVVDIFECEKGSLHVNEAFSFVEFLKTEDNMVYQLVGTQLKNKKFPLIRYNTGDLVEYDPNFVCSCGRNSRVVKKIIGRDEDFLILRNNSKIGRLDHIFKNTENIIESQIIQKKKGEAIFKIVKSDFFMDKDQMILERNIKEILGDDFSFSINYCDSIQKSKNGKLKQVVNLIK